MGATDVRVGNLEADLAGLKAQTIGGTAPAGASSSTGDISQMVKYLTLNLPTAGRNPYAPNYFDSWGFYANQVVYNTGVNTDTSFGTSANILRAGYYLASNGASLGQQNVLTSGAEIYTLKMNTTAVSGNAAELYGLGAIHTSWPRYTPLAYPGYDATIYPLREWVMEMRVVPGTLSNIDIFMGFFDRVTGVDPFAASQYCAGLCFKPSNNAASYTAVCNNGGATPAYSAAVAAASTTAMQTLKAVVTSTNVRVSVDGGAETTFSTQHPGGTRQTMLPYLSVQTREAAAKSIYIGRFHDWIR